MPTPPIPLPSSTWTSTAVTLFRRRDLCDDYYSPYGCNWRHILLGTLTGLSIILFAFLVYRFIVVQGEKKSDRARGSGEEGDVDLEEGSAFASTERPISEVPPAYAVRAACGGERMERLPKYEPPVGRS